MKDLQDAKSSLTESIRKFDTILPRIPSEVNHIDRVLVLLDNTPKTRTALLYAHLVEQRLGVHADRIILLESEMSQLTTKAKIEELRQEIRHLLPTVVDQDFSTKVVQEDALTYLTGYSNLNPNALVIVPTPYFEDIGAEDIKSLGLVADIAITHIDNPVLIVERAEGDMPIAFNKVVILVYDLLQLNNLYKQASFYFPSAELHFLLINLVEKIQESGYFETLTSDEFDEHVREFETEARVILSGLEAMATKESIQISHKIIHHDIIPALDIGINEIDPDIIIFSLKERSEDLLSQFKMLYLRRGEIRHGILILPDRDEHNS